MTDAPTKKELLQTSIKEQVKYFNHNLNFFKFSVVFNDDDMNLFLEWAGFKHLAYFSKSHFITTNQLNEIYQTTIKNIQSSIEESK
ncbi:hypothetical protein [Cupriavidus sp. H19C3]|uniref:hypothetical protein n=1 Tax=Cupriavidus sp. H19C3 TaxID=3241603 RepID=UPI003BF7A3C1